MANNIAWLATPAISTNHTARGILVAAERFINETGMDETGMVGCES